MATKAQHARIYRPLPSLLRAMREEAELTQRELGDAIGHAQSWVYNCETGNRRVDLAEFVIWCKACDVTPESGMKRFLCKK